MAAGGVRLDLQVGLDLTFLRSQLASLGSLAQNYPLSISVDLNTSEIERQIKNLGKEIKVSINDAQIDAASKRLQTLLDKLDSVSKEKVTLPVTGTASLSQKEARKIRTQLRSQVLAEGGKVLIPASIDPKVTASDINGLKRQIQDKLGTVTVNVKTNLEAAAISGGSKTRAEIDADVRRGLQAISEIGAARMAGGAGVTESARREQLKQALSTSGQDIGSIKDIGRQLGVKGVGRYSNVSNLIEKIASEAAVEMIAKYLDPQAVMRNPDRSGLQKVLDTFARGVFNMLGIDPASLRQKRLPPSIDWPAQVPQQPFTGPSSSGRLLTGAPSMLGLPGIAMGDQKRLVGDILSPSLKEVLRSAANTFVDLVRNELNAAIRSVNVRDLGTKMQAALAPGRVAGLLPAAVGRAPSIYGGGRTEESRAAMLARREREARMRSALRGVDVMAEGVSGRIPSPYSYAYRPSPSSVSAMVPYQRAGALAVSGGGGGGATPPGGGGRGGGGPFGGGLPNINLPGAGIVREIGQEFAFATKQVLLFGTAYKALAFLQAFPGEVGAAVGQLQSFRNTLKAISPSAEEAARSNQFILDLVDKYNLPLQSARDGFTKLYASMQPAGFSGEQVRDLFLGISQAAASFGMSADKVDRVNYAFAQMASKGQVMSEELKGQLGDVLPGAMAIFAKAAGFEGPGAIQKFSAALEDGAYKGKAMTALLNNVGVVMRKQFGPGAEGAALTFQGIINRMQNSMKLLYESFEPVAVGFLNTVVVPLTTGIKTITDGFGAFLSGMQAKTTGGFAFAQELEKLRPTFDGLKANLMGLLPMFKDFGRILLEVGKIFLQLAGNPVAGYLMKLYLIFGPLNMALNVMKGLWASNAVQLVLFNTRVATGTGTLAAFRGMMAATGNTAGQTAAAIRGAGLTMRAFFASTGVGLVLVGISLLIERFMSLGQRMDEVRAKAQGAAQAIRSMSATEARVAEQQAATDVKALRELQKQKPQGGLLGPKYSVTDTRQRAALERAGLTTTAIAIKGGGVGRGVESFRIESAIQKREADMREAEFRRKQIKFEEKSTQTPTTFAPVVGVAGEDGAKSKKADKAAKEAARLREEIAKQAQAASDALFTEQQRLLVLQQTNPTAKALVEYANQELVIQRELSRGLADAKSKKEADDLRAQASTQQQINALELTRNLEEARKQAMQPLEDALKNQREQLLAEKDIEQLVSEGMTPARAKEVAEIRKITRAALETVDAQISVLDEQIKTTNAAILEREAREGSTKAVEKLRDELKKLEEERAKAKGDKGGISGKGAAAEAGVPKEKDKDKKPMDYIKDAATAAQEELAKLTNWGYQAAEGAKAIGSAFGQAFKDIASGSKTTQEALASMFQSIADHFLDMAAQIIAQMLIMYALKLITGLFAGFAGSAGGGTSTGGFKVPDLGKYSFGGFGSGAIPKPFADGGYVMGPTRALVGEGGEGEYIIPASKMQAAMSRYATGARGSSVIPSAGNTGATTETAIPEGTMITGGIDVRYSVERINSVDYVTADQFQRGISQAAQQGAQQGELRTIRRLQQSRSTRSRLGMI